jgi:Zn-dependent protease
MPLVMSDSVFTVIIQFLVLLLSLTIHECAHAWTSDRLGDPTARLLGRVSLNPIVHSDLWGTIVFPLVGLQYGFMFGWAKPVPVNTANLRNPSRDHMLVALAGPVSNMVLATLMFAALMVMKSLSPGAESIVRTVVYFAVPHGSSVLAPLAMFAFYGMIINVVLAIFNLIPVAPLDGAAVLSGLLPRNMAEGLDRLQAYSFMIFILMLVSGIPSYLFDPPILFLRQVLVAS